MVFIPNRIDLYYTNIKIISIISEIKNMNVPLTIKLESLSLNNASKYDSKRATNISTRPVNPASALKTLPKMNARIS